MIDNERWNQAIERAREFKSIYKELGPVGIFGLTAIANDIRLYEAGDRSEALLESLEGIE